MSDRFVCLYCPQIDTPVAWERGQTLFQAVLFGNSSHVHKCAYEELRFLMALDEFR